MTVRIQLAVQGGGAKLCGLLAALDGVQRLERDGVLTVTRIAGTSAGAIAAALYAAHVDFDRLRDRIRSNRPALRRLVPPLGPLDYLTAVRGKPIVRLEPVQKALQQAFGAAVTRFEHLKVPLIVLASDLTNGKSHVYDRPETELVNAVIDSCAIPFYFRGPGAANGAPLIVDGGICENFPVEVLKPFEAEDGPVVGLTFQPSAPGVTPTSALRLGRALLETAMDNSVRRAQRLLGSERLLTLEGDIDMLDFQRALGEGMDHRYEATRYRAQEFFHGLAARLTGEAAAPAPTVDVESSQGDEESPAILQAHADLYQAQHAGVRMHYHAVRMLVRAGGLAVGPRTPGDAAGATRLHRAANGATSPAPDDLVYRLVFSAADEPLDCVRIVVLEEEEFDFLRTSRTAVRDRHYGRLRTIDLRARDRRDPEDRAYLLFFDPRIRPEDPQTSPAHQKAPYTLQYTHHVTGLLTDLLLDGVDTLAFVTERAAGLTPRLELAVTLPHTMPGYAMRASDDTTSRTNRGRAMTPEELGRLESELMLGPDQYAVGWVGLDVEPGQMFAAEVYAPGK